MLNDETQVTSETASAAPVGATVAETPADPLAALQQEVAALQDKNLRLMAELRNSAQRAQREKAEALKFAEGDFARDLLVVLDDLQRTRESARNATAVAAVADGVRIVHEHLLKLFKDHQIVPIEAVGQPFDPAVHEALLQQSSDTVPAGTVLAEVAAGYRMHERVLRPARVIVSSGPPASPPAAAGAKS